jgi:hypothetical protein
MRMMAIAVGAVLLAAGGAYAEGYSSSPATGGNNCLWTYNIVKTDVAPDERSITFHMKDGSTWVNTLPAQCRGLRLHGFTYAARTDMEVCAKQGIKLIEIGTVCQLGPFAPGPTLDPAPQY